MSKVGVLAAACAMFTMAAVAASGGEMKQIEVETAIGEGTDQQVDKLYENQWTRLVQITLRNGKTLESHSAKEAVTIHCVAGEGTLVLPDRGVSMKPGVIVPLEPNIPHSVQTGESVSVLVTRFLKETSGEKRPEEHKH